ncbi:MAG TPA: hypothetical protein VLZ83_10970 [Edaphocola sp.]|nr:hypothetical protein [Edaphocola sp.]
MQQYNEIFELLSASQYDYLDKVLVSIKYANVNLDTTHNIKERYLFTYENYSGRLLKIKHKVNDAQLWEDLTTNTYDDMGRLATKTYGLDAERQEFSYNIRGELSGINENYALTGDKQGKNIRFGEALRYDYGFTHPRYDGQISGVVWRGATRTRSSAYAYTYDRVGRMLHGEFFSGNPTSNAVPTTWSNGDINYSEQVQYDIAGNITGLSRYGIANVMTMPNPPVKIDRLAYTYFPNSNKLEKVIDTNTNSYGRGEFVNGPAQGYDYDVSGNLTQDLSKGISQISYTWFNKPQKITFPTGKTIEYVYDAAGSKLREYISDSGQIKKIDYAGNIVFENQQVQFISTPVGRTAYKNNKFLEEYFIKDHLGNIRAIIGQIEREIGIESREPLLYTAGYEPIDAVQEESLFETIAEVRDTKPGSTNTNDGYAAQLEGEEKAIGTSIFLKVMAGDKISVNTDNFYNQLTSQPEDATGGSSVLEQILGSMASGGGNVVIPEGISSSGLFTGGFDPTQLNSAYETLQQAIGDSSRPKSFLNYLFFDETMQLRSEHSHLWQADGEGNWSDIGTAENNAIEISENGMILVYLSNESIEQVHFDNLVVGQEAGSLLEERHYYPYGLPIQGWGSTAAGSLSNRQMYQGNEYRQEIGLNWMDFHNRQLGLP